MSMHNNFSDASNESQQMQLLEGHFLDDIMAGLRSGRGDDQSMIEFQTDLSVMSGAGSSNHQTLSFQRPTIVPSDINHTSPMDEMVIKYRDEIRRHVVTWSFGEEPDYTSAYVDPLTRECFLSGELVNRNVVFSNSLIWYKSADEASNAALARAIDCFEYRERTPRPLGRRVKEDPYDNGSGPPFPQSIPVDTWKQIRRLQLHQRKTAAAAATVVSEMSSLTPEKHRSAKPASAPKARSENDNPKTKLHERYFLGFVNGTKVTNFSIPKENFVAWRVGVDHQPMFSAAFVCPLSGEIFLSGELIHFGENESFEKNNLMWYLSKKKSVEAAAATAEDCFQFREEIAHDGVSQQIQFCISPPYLEGKEPLETSNLQDIIPHEYWIKIQTLQEAAAWRKL
eukprot:scaffold4844_cov112-Cylindrotheca_fusiformis.AAC.7